MQTETNKTKAVTKKTTAQAPALSADLAGSWGTEEATSEDIIIPKILLMHGQSEKVLAGEKTQGELVKSTDYQTLAKKGETVRIIPFIMKKTWRISEMVGGQAEWRGEEPWTPDNTDLPWEYEQEGKSYRRDQAYNFYALLADEIDAGKFTFPVKLQFTRTSRKAGKILANHFANCKMMRTPPATVSFEIGSEFINGDKNKYFVFTAKPSAFVGETEVRACKQWYDMMSKNAEKIKDHEVTEVTEATETEMENF